MLLLIVVNSQVSIFNQLSATTSINTDTTVSMHTMPGPSLHRQHVRHPSVSLPPAAADANIEELASLSTMEQEILQSLVEGRGITKYEHIRLLEVCESCQQTFAASALQAHIITCSES